MRASKCFFLILIVFFCVSSSVHAGWGSLLNFFWSAVYPEENDVGQDVKDFSLTADNPVTQLSVTGLTFNAPVVKTWEGRSDCASSGSTGLSEAVDWGGRRLSGASEPDELNGFEQIALLAAGEYEGAEDFFEDITASDYVKIWKSARRSILECHALILNFREAIRGFGDLHFPSDIRMPHLVEDEPLPCASLQEFEVAYDRLCVLYASYLRQAVLLGFGGVGVVRLQDSFKLTYPPQLTFGSCSLCGAMSSGWDDFNCEDCGESMIMMPEGGRDFSDFSRDLRVLLLQIEACKKAVRAILVQMRHS